MKKEGEICNFIVCLSIVPFCPLLSGMLWYQWFLVLDEISGNSLFYFICVAFTYAVLFSLAFFRQQVIHTQAYWQQIIGLECNLYLYQFNYCTMDVANELLYIWFNPVYKVRSIESRVQKTTVTLKMDLIKYVQNMFL